MATYLSAVNDVLARLREDSVASVTTNAYSSLIGKFINDAKRSVEDSWNWDALYTVSTVTTSDGSSNYVVTGSGQKQKMVTVNCTTASNQGQMINVPRQWILDQQDLTTVQTQAPSYYAWNGTDGTDSKVELFPTPNGVYTLKFRMYVPQVALSADADVLLVPSEPVILGAYARALVERGEDGGLSSSEAYAMYKSSLADHIAIEATRYVENDCWEAV